MPSPIDLIAKPDAVLLDLPSTSGEAVIRAMHERLVAGDIANDAALFLSDLLERSSVASVCLASDLALPHARTSSVDRLVLAVGRVVAPGAAFDPEHPYVRLVFLIGAPKESVKSYLDLVAGISRLLKTGSTKAQLLAAKDEAEFSALLGGAVKR